MLADVLPDPGRPLDQVFTYRVPDSLQSCVEEGIQVLVPFGRQTAPGFVIRLHDEPPDRAESLKEILDVPEGALAIHGSALPLARWISQHYLCSLGQALRLALPPGTTFKIRRTVRLGGEEAVARARERRPSCAPILDALAGGEVSMASLRRRLRRADLSGTLAWLGARGAVIFRSFIAAPRVKPLLRLAAEPAAANLLREAESRAAKAPKQAAVLRSVARAGGPVPVAELCRELKTSQGTVRSLARQGLLRIRTVEVAREAPGAARPLPKPPANLTLDQGAALGRIAAGLEGGEPPVFLLFGVPGSGKSEVILRAAQHVISKGRQTVVLMPEISLTAEAVALFRQRFPGRTAVLHSGLSPGDRYDEWRRVQRGEAAVVVGTRSAVFAPCPRLGLIVLDDEHDPSYKQDNPPAYHARDVAVQRARLEGAAVILSSAAPSLESFYAAEQGRYMLLHLSTKAGATPMPRMTCADLRGMGARLFSPRLVMAMKEALDARGQVLLFLNRRGFSTVLLCPTCGRAAKCPSCDVCFTYHLPSRKLVCHHCGTEVPAPDACSHCGNPHMVYRGFGTQRLEQEIRRVYPAATVGRLDSDSTTGKGAHGRIVADFRRARTRVLIGTQMAAKSSDLAGVALVGVMIADASLDLPDFRAAERTFQMLTQLAGRSGKGKSPGRVVLQTYQPEHYAIQAALRQDYPGFYARELAARKEHGFPPFSVLAALTASAPDQEKARSHALALAKRLAGFGGSLQMLGPAPAPMGRLKGRHRWQILLLAADYGALLTPVRQVLNSLWPPRSVAVAVDVDPIALL